MISYMILHYNRPYLLDINIKLIRKYLPNVQIIVADDGSDKNIIDCISKYEIDDLYVQKKNQNTWKEGTCSTTIKKARKLSKHEYFVFSEDDFFYCANPVTVPYDSQEGNLMPLVYFPANTNINILNEGLYLLTNNNNIKNVQLAKDHIRVPVSSPVSSSNYSWSFVDHRKKQACYYCNWPSMLRTNEYFSIEIESGWAIWNYEAKLSKSFDTKFGKTTDWAVVPQNRFYVHVGMAFSKRLNNFVYSKKRSKYGRRIQEQMFNRVLEKNVEGFGSLLTQSYLKGQFIIDFDEMIQNGLNEAFVSAFKRLNKYV